MHVLLQDVRYGLRLLRSTPGFTAVAVLTIALGIAVNTTVFSWVNAVLIDPLPGTDSRDLYFVETYATGRIPGAHVSWRDYLDYREGMRLADGLAIGKHAVFNVGPEGKPQRVWGELVSGNYFSVLRVPMTAGRGFHDEEGRDRAVPVAVISERLWRRMFHSDPATVGRTIRVNRHELTIVGIANPAFNGGTPGLLYDIWMPYPMEPVLGVGGSLTYRATRDGTATVVRLKPGVTLEQGRSELEAIASRLAAAFPRTNAAVHATLVPPAEGHNGAQRILREPLQILLAVGGLVLLIVCANVANLLLARAVTRQREFGIRLALGSGRNRLVRQVLTETVILAIAGSGVGLLLMLWMRDSLVALLPAHDLPVSLSTPVDAATLAFTLTICALTTIASGTLPALFSARSDVNEKLKQGGRSDAAGSGSHRTRSVLIVAEIALASVALIGAALFVRSFRNLTSVDPGFNPDNVLVANFYLSPAGYSTEQEIAFCRRLRDRVSTLPGVAAVTYADQTPHDVAPHPWHQLAIQGYTPRPGEDMYIQRTFVGTGFFDLLKIPLLEGRDFTELDTRSAPRVMVVNQAFARRFFGGASPLGRTVRLENVDHRVVGMVRDARYNSPTEAPIPYFYANYDQSFGTGLPTRLFVRTRGNPDDLVPALRQEVMAIDPNAATFHALSLREQTSGAVFGQRAAAAVLTALGAMALLLAAIGLYGVMSYAVSQRTQELGIRMALGASAPQIVWMVMTRGFALVAAGMGVGMVLSWWLARAASSMLFNVSTVDPAAYGGATVFLALIAGLAAALPAWRASRLDPMMALRSE